MPKVFISIVHYNNTTATINCLESLGKTVIQGFELGILVIDNGSKENFELKKKSDNTTIIRSDKNLGFSGGQNKGIQCAIDAGAEYVVVLNNDTVVDKDFIIELLRVCNTQKDISVVCPKIYYAPGSEFHKDRYKKEHLGKVIWYAGARIDLENVVGVHFGVDAVDMGQFDETKETDIATGCCMMVKREVFEKIGKFDERYFMYYEDADFSLRVKKAGYRIFFAPKAVIWHENASSGGGSGSELQDYYISRNRLLFGIKYATLKTKLSLIKEAVTLLSHGRKWQRQGVKDYLLQRLGKGTYK